MHDMRTLMTNMASKRQFADFILDSDWLKSFRYQCYCSGWLLVVQSVRNNQQSAEKMGVFGWCGCWRHQFESNISVKSFSLSNFSCTKRLQTMWGADCGLRQRNKIVMCFTRGAIVPHWWHKKGTELVEHSFALFWGLGKSARFAGRAKNRKLFRWNVTWASIFLFKEWRHKLICNFLLRPRWGCS
jgi:hypothetical protein